MHIHKRIQEYFIPHYLQKEGVYLRNDDFGNNADYVFFCDVNGDALDDGVAYYPSQKSGNLSVALSDGVKLITPTKWADLNLSDFWKIVFGEILMVIKCLM